MADEPEDSIFAQLQNGICPEPGAGLGGIEVVGDGIIRRIQGDGITCSIYQPGNAGEKLIGLTIAQAAVEKLQQGITLQLKHTIRVGDCCLRICIINGNGVIISPF